MLMEPGICPGSVSVSEEVMSQSGVNKAESDLCCDLQHGVLLSSVNTDNFHKRFHKKTQMYMQ